MTSDGSPEIKEPNSRSAHHGPIYDALMKLTRGKENEYYQGLGKIAANFARIEVATTLLVGLLSGMKPEIGFALIDDMPLSVAVRKLEKMISLRVTEEKDLEKIKSVIKRIRKASEKRNDYIHGIWYLLGKEIGVRHDWKDRTSNSVPLNELDEFNTTLEILLMDLTDVTDVISDI